MDRELWTELKSDEIKIKGAAIMSELVGSGALNVIAAAITTGVANPGEAVRIIGEQANMEVVSQSHHINKMLEHAVEKAGEKLHNGIEKVSHRIKGSLKEIKNEIQESFAPTNFTSMVASKVKLPPISISR